MPTDPAVLLQRLHTRLGALNLRLADLESQAQYLPPEAITTTLRTLLLDLAEDCLALVQDHERHRRE